MKSWYLAVDLTKMSIGDLGIDWRDDGFEEMGVCCVLFDFCFGSDAGGLWREAADGGAVVGPWGFFSGRR